MNAVPSICAKCGDRLLGFGTLFDEGLVDRLRVQYEQVDVYAIAAQVQDMVRRGKGVRNPSGLLVDKVRHAASQRAISVGTAADRSEIQRYAEFHAALYRAIAREQLSPSDVAHRLVVARASGLPRLNPFVSDALVAFGDDWPEEA